MIPAGWALFIVGTLVAAACGAKLEPLWAPFGVGIVLALAGAILLRRSQTAQGSVAEEDGGISDLPTLRVRYEALVGEVSAARDLGGEELKLAVEAILLERLLPIIDARLLLASAHGVEHYAEVFTPTAGGERCLNRAWSMLVDGSGEPEAEVGTALAYFEQGLSSWPGSAET